MIFFCARWQDHIGQLIVLRFDIRNGVLAPDQTTKQKQNRPLEHKRRIYHVESVPRFITIVQACACDCLWQPMVFRVSISLLQRFPIPPFRKIDFEIEPMRRSVSCLSSVPCLGVRSMVDQSSFIRFAFADVSAFVSPVSFCALHTCECAIRLARASSAVRAMMLLCV